MMKIYEHKLQSREVLQSPARRSFFTDFSVPFKMVYVFLEPIVFALFLLTEILKSFFIHTRNYVQLFRPCLQVLH